MSALRILGERLAREQDALLARSPEGDTFGHPVRRRRRRTAMLPVAAAFVVMVAAAAVAVVSFRARRGGAPDVLGVTVGGEAIARDQWISAPMDASLPIRFSEGTEVALQPEGQARVIELTETGAHLMLESGRALVSVTPNRKGHWTFSAGPFIVEVKGTRFEIGWNPRDDIFQVTLSEGKVTISGCALGDARPLFAGETLRASCRTHDFRIAPTAAPSSFPARAEEPVDSPMPAPSVSAIVAAPSSSRPFGGVAGETWQSLARANRFKEAFRRVNERGFDAELARADAEDLLLLGDVSRLSGNYGHALRAYEKVRSRAPGTERAANAAFAMGRVYFDQRDAYGEAARWFATYSSERSDGPLAREALGRQMEALSRAGDRAGADRAAEQYLRQYPKGPHAPLARTLRLKDN
jgi:transmembrane sensor